MVVSAEEVQKKLDIHEREMRLLAGTYITTALFLTKFLLRAQCNFAEASAEQKDWVSLQLGQLLATFGFEITDEDPWAT